MLLQEGPEWAEECAGALDVVRQRYVEACRRLGITPRVQPRPIADPNIPRG